MDVVSFKLIDVNLTKRERNTFHIPLDEQHSVTICKRKADVHIGIYKVDAKGKRRGINLPLSLWQNIKMSDDIIDLAVSFIQGVTGHFPQDGEE